MNSGRLIEYRREGLKSRPHRRRGAVLIVILVCFAVAAVLFMLVASQSVVAHRASERQLWTSQARWVAEAAMERAAARLIADANYAGETWTIPAAELSGKEAAVARIRVERVADRPNRRLIRVEADYPDAPVHRSRWTTQITIDRPAPTTKKAAEKS
jgi:Tfp pilus assembly protein PilX